ncbi:MAG: hypothetical protein J1F64_07245 [Oscillospiraceae bacterium]|nr:hypothetical protein [Oscillospiraceae bacterium]
MKIPYKVFKTNVEFSDETVTFTKGEAAGFSNIRYEEPISIPYNSITGIYVNKKYSIPNIIFAIIAVIFSIVIAISIEVFMVIICVIIAASIAVWYGSTAELIIRHYTGEYIVPTEFQTDAEDLRHRIDIAVNQSRMQI